MSSYHSQTIEQVFVNLKTSETGLSEDVAKKRLEEFGLNVLPRVGAKLNKIKIFFSQWKSPLLLILLIAGIVSGLLGEYIDMSVILFTAIMNAAIGFFQENKAGQALDRLRDMVEYKALVLRNGIKKQVISSHLVPGDILLLEAGDKVQADGRIVECVGLEVNEAPLTGESEVVKKHTRKVNESAVIGDQLDMVFRGTEIINGKARVIVTATGMSTEIGKIAAFLKRTPDDPTPLQTQLSKMGKVIGIGVLFISAAIFILGMFARAGEHSFIEMFETAVAIAAAAIPEGLAISLTLVLAIGTQCILKRKALVRKLVAAETLGSVSVICADKTGTLTEGNIRVNRIITADEDLDWASLSKLNFHNTADEEKHAGSALALRIAVLANDSVLLNPEAKEEEWQFLGDTTDIALAHAGMLTGLEKHHLDAAVGRVAEIPFDSRNKYHATMHHRFTNETMIYVKGATEVLLPKCVQNKKLKWFEEKEKELAGHGLRLLAVAYKKFDKFLDALKPEDLKDLTFVGLIAMADPLREDVKKSIELTRQAGIRTIMITGDHVRTAQAIARELGLPCTDGHILDGQKLEAMSDDELQVAVKNLYIFARVDPKHKIRIVRALQANGEVTAMTGDGVNDAPALRGADIGVALGSGADVAKDVSDMIILDNDFSTIVAAIEEGRRIYQNIRKVVLYLLAGSFAEVVLIGGGLIAGLPLAVLPVQILWVNLIEDSFPNAALAFDKGDAENMKDKPRKKNEPVIDREMKIMITIISIVSNVALFGIYYFFLRFTNNIALTRTIIFVGLGIGSLLYVYSVRSMKKMIWQMPLVDNKYLTGAVLLGWVMLVGAVYLKPLQIFLRTVPLHWEHWVVLFAFGLMNVVLIEVVKVVFLARRKSSILNLQS